MIISTTVFGEVGRDHDLLSISATFTYDGGHFSQVDILLSHLKSSGPQRSSQHVAMERVARVAAGTSYAIWGKARWKMNHDAVVGAGEPAIEGLERMTARLGLTLRYFRSSFIELLRRRNEPAPSLSPREISPLLCLPKEEGELFPSLVDAFFYRKMDGEWRREKAHHYTYPAVVLARDAAAGSLTLHYLSDGLGVDSNDEAHSIAAVPASEALLASASVQRRLLATDCAWTSTALSLLQEMEFLGGGEKWLETQDPL